MGSYKVAHIERPRGLVFLSMCYIVAILSSLYAAKYLEGVRERQTTNDQRQTTNDKRQTTNDKRPTTNDKRQTTNDIR